jgi:hypothetical protein
MMTPDHNIAPAPVAEELIHLNPGDHDHPEQVVNVDQLVSFPEYQRI